MYIFRKRFFISWVLSSLVMFAISYVWHGVVLNDLAKINYPLTLFLIFAGLVYFVVGFLLTRFYQSRIFSKRFKDSFINRGLAAGAIAGFVIYLVVLVMGVSVTHVLTLEYLLIDLGWQIFEQMAGGFVVALCHVMVWDPVPLPEEVDR
jgi:hypothetical protein